MDADRFRNDAFTLSEIGYQLMDRLFMLLCFDLVWALGRYEHEISF